MKLFTREMTSAFGDLLAAVDPAGALVRLTFVDGEDGRARAERELAALGASLAADETGRADAVASALAAYEAGDADALDALAIAPPGTAFQHLVWRELRRVRPGETVSYGELARRIGRPTAVRAVARANATNRLVIVVPCHRVIGADGSLTGYAFGLELKRALLEHEATATVGASGSARGTGRDHF